MLSPREKDVASLLQDQSCSLPAQALISCVFCRINPAACTHGVRYQDLPRLGTVTDTPGELHRSAEQVLLFGHRPLDGDSALQRARGGSERRHDAVAGVLDLVAAVRAERRTDDVVVGAANLLRLRVAELLSKSGRGLHIGEEDSVNVAGLRRFGRRFGRAAFV